MYRLVEFISGKVNTVSKVQVQVQVQGWELKGTEARVKNFWLLKASRLLSLRDWFVF